MSKRSKKILIIEDDEILLPVLIDKFTNRNFLVFSANNGEDGLKIALQQRPDAILLDILIPKIDGVVLLNKLKELPTTKNIPVIILTNIGLSEKVIEMTKLGADDYLIKSDWTLEDVAKKVEERLGIS